VASRQELIDLLVAHGDSPRTARRRLRAWEGHHIRQMTAEIRTYLDAHPEPKKRKGGSDG
jgi:hypothetical protein